MQTERVFVFSPDYEFVENDGVIYQKLKSGILVKSDAAVNVVLKANED